MADSCPPRRPDSSSGGVGSGGEGEKGKRPAAPTSALRLIPTVIEYFNERGGAKFLQGDAGSPCGFFGRDRAAVYCAEEEVKQALAGGGIVEDVADQGGAGGFFDEVAEAFAGGVE